MTNVISGDRETITTIATHLLFQNGKPNSTYSFTVAAYTVALGPASEPTVVNTEPNINGSNELDLQCRDKYGSELKIMPTTAALGALNGVFAAIVIVLGIVCICVLACFYHNYIKKKIRYVNLYYVKPGNIINLTMFKVVMKNKVDWWIVTKDVQQAVS